MVKTTFIGKKDYKKGPTCITPWSYIHFLTGLNIFLIINSIKVVPYIYNLIIFFILHTIYECNDYIKTYIIYDKNDQSTLINSIWDTIFALFGWILGYLLLYKLKNIYIIIPIGIQIISIIIFIKFKYD